MDTYQAGDICTYSFGNKNRSVAIVEIVRLLDDPSGAAEVRFLDVIIDDTGNGFFLYLLKSGNTMNASLQFLEKEGSVEIGGEVSWASAANSHVQLPMLSICWVFRSFAIQELNCIAGAHSVMIENHILT